MSTKTVILTVIVVIILGAALGTWLGLRSQSMPLDLNTTIPTQAELNQAGLDVSFEDFCSITETAWQCYFVGPGPIDFDPYLDQPGIDIYQELCEQQGGQWSCTDICFPEDPRVCEFK